MSKKMIKIVSVVAAVVAFVVAGFVWFNGTQADTNTPSTSVPETTTSTESPAEETEQRESTGTTITTGPSDFGTVLFDGTGQAIYIWEVEKSSTAECYGDCAEAWPPVLADGAPIANGAVDESLLGTTIRNDGTVQVTYNGHPLYYYAHEAPGEVKCHNISTHGGLWWVIKPDGRRAD